MNPLMQFIINQIILIWVISLMADIHEVIKSELIQTINMSLYLGKQFIFTNTILIQTSKLIPLNISISITEQPHPQNSLNDNPFTVINSKYVKNVRESFKLLLMLLELDSYRERERQNQEMRQREREDENMNGSSLALLNLVQMSEDLANVATVLNDNDLNPYYLFMNPLLKFRYYRKLQSLRREIQSNTQFLNSNEDLDVDYLIYKLHQIQLYVDTLKSIKLSLSQQKFIKICLIALLKHFQSNNQSILKAALQQKLFENIQQNKLEYLASLVEIRQRMAVDRKVIGMYGRFLLHKEIGQKNLDNNEPFKQKFYRSMVKPIGVTIILLSVMGMFSQ